VADHYQHIAIISVTALVAAGFSFWQRRTQSSARWAAQIGAAALVGALTLLTWNQNRLYADPITLYTATLQQNPDCWMAHLNLGNALLVNGQMQEAVNHFEEALRLKPNYAEAHYNLGNCAAQTGHMELAISQYRQALQIDPEDARAHNNLGAALFQTGHTAEAIEQYQLALVINPDYAEAHGNFGAALSESKRFLEAMAQLQQAVQLKPDFTKAWMDLALVYASLQQPENAVRSAETAARLANSQKQLGMEKQIEDWLTKYRGAANDDREKLPDSPGSRSSP
jgi:tetratricopeptide (TPR) repeat protein